MNNDAGKKDKLQRRYRYRWLQRDLTDNRGHGIQIHAEQSEAILAFIDGFRWRKGESSTISIHLYRSNIATSHLREEELRSILIKMLEEGSMSHGGLGHGLSAMFNA